MTDLMKILACAGLSACLLTGCGDETDKDTNGTGDTHAEGDGHDHDGDGHDDHADGDHDHDGDGHDDHADAGGHDHDEASLGTTSIGGVTVECWQAHGDVEPGKEMALVVKLPDSAAGQATVRAWIGTDDRLSSMVGKGVYAPSHDDYDIHTSAPNPLPEGAKWWIEVERPDGTKAVGSIDFL